MHTGISDATYEQSLCKKHFLFVFPIKLILYYAGCRQRTDELWFNLSEVTLSTNWVMWFKINCVMIRIAVSACSWNSRFVVLTNEKQKIEKRDMGESSTLDLWDLLGTKSLWITKQHICLILWFRPTLLSFCRLSLRLCSVWPQTGFQGFSERLMAHRTPADLIKQTLRAYLHTTDSSEKTNPARNQKPQTVQSQSLDSGELGGTIWKQHNYSKKDLCVNILISQIWNSLNQNESN